MQRPKRILIFGILCLVMALLSGLDNLGTLIAAIVGPAMTAQPEGMELPALMQEANHAVGAALAKPTYRWLSGIESLLGAIMAGVLVVGAIGLLQDRKWGVSLAKAWAYFAIGSAAFTVFLHAKFVVPEYTLAVPSEEAMFGVACMLPILWVFPVLILTMLTRPIVTDYLNARAKQMHMAPPPPAPAGYTHHPHAHQPVDAQHHVGQPNQTMQPVSRPKPPPPPQTPPAFDEHWRDDPWNDPRSE